MAVSTTQSVGAKAEQIALEYLLDKGLRCLQRNFRSRFGEIDLIMHDGSCLIFVEVRFRNQNNFASAALSIGKPKQKKIIRTASFFLRRAQAYANEIIRFDVLAIDRAVTGQYTIQWIRDAFRPG